MVFLECHDKDGIRVLIPVDRIITISRSDVDGTAMIDLTVDSAGNLGGLATRELYSEIISKLASTEIYHFC